MAKINFDRWHPLYQQDLERIAETIPEDKIHNKDVIVTGCTGLLGTLIIDVLMWLNINRESGIRIKALARNKNKVEARFKKYLESDLFIFTQYDAFTKLENIRANYIFHCVGNSHPALFASDPVGTLLGNIIGVKNILDLANETEATTLILSSGEVYGDNMDPDKKMNENYIGYLPIDNARSCYPEGKRAVESLCQSYISQYGTEIKIARPCRIFGPTMTEDDNKVSAQFLKNAKRGESLMLKSAGTQMFSYIYGADAVSAILKIMFDGITGEAYNISNELCDIRLKDFARVIASKGNVDMKQECIGEAGGSKVMNALLDNSKLKGLGWVPFYDMDSAVSRTLEIMI